MYILGLSSTSPVTLLLVLPPTVQVWPKAVDCELFNPARASSEMRDRLAGSLAPYKPLDGISSSNDGSKEPLLLYVGRVSPEKNVTLLKTVLQKLPGARLAIVGDGPALEVSCVLTPVCHRVVHITS